MTRHVYRLPCLAGRQAFTVYRKKKRTRLLITAGPTQELLDPVRFISNHSTGTMGYTLAAEAKNQGYRVTLISGPTNLNPPKGIKFIPVTTAKEMHRAVKKHFPTSDCLIMTAAVCDFHPLKFSSQKIRKENFKDLKLTQTVDILYEIGKRKGKKILVGFALESENLIKNAREKLHKKNLDLVIAQSVDKRQTPFGKNKVSPILIRQDGSCQKIPACSKSQLSRIILKELRSLHPH